MPGRASPITAPVIDLTAEQRTRRPQHTPHQMLVIEPDDLMARVTKFLLETQGYEARIATSRADAKAVLARLLPDLIVMEADIHEEDGFELCRRLRAEGFAAPIIFLTARATTPDRIAGLRLGADDYIVKPIEPGEFLARVRAVLRRTTATPASGPTHLGSLGLQLNFSTLTATDATGHRYTLTATEMRLLECLAAHAGTIVPRDTLTEWVWGFDDEGESNRLEVYIGRLRRKFGAEGSACFSISTVRGSGYRLQVQYPGPLPGLTAGRLVQNGR